MFIATLVISGRDWVWPAAGLLAATVVLLAWGYRRTLAPGSTRGFCLLLKSLGFLTLIACLLEPLWTSQRARPGSNFFVVIADNSAGMQIKDHGETRSRGEVLREILTPNNARWLDGLDENFRLRRYLFDSRLNGARDFSELTFDGRASAIGTALRALSERFRGQPLAGVLLLTDGNATDLSEGVTGFSGLPPVYPVVIGRDSEIKDIAFQKIAVNHVAFEDAPVTVQADVSAVGYAGNPVAVQVFELDGAKAEEQTRRPAAASETIPFRLQLRPAAAGVSFYRIRVAEQGEWSQFESPEKSTETTLANNTRVLVVDRGRGPYRILYVSGRANWEYKFLSRALAEDDQIELVGMIRMAKREPKFEFISRPGETSNPMFRGFGNQSPEEIERYDQPVIIRVYPHDESRLRLETKLSRGFPSTAEDLYDFHAVILDDLEAAFFTRDQMTLLQQFVSERGGGLFMLGGAESFHQGKYARTPIGDMLPVYLDHLTPTTTPARVRLSLTPEGLLQPWARLRTTESDEKARLDDLPPFQVLNLVRDTKPGASVIAEARDERGRNFPALAVQRFGNGRVGAFMIGDVWRWGLRDEASRKDMDKAWRQMMRWLVADVPERVQLAVERKRDDPNEAVLLKVRVRDKKFQLLDNATVRLSVRVVTSAISTTNSGDTGQVVRMNAEPAVSERGLYEATYIPRETGGYSVEAVAVDEAGVDIGRAEAGWIADPAAEEFRSLKPNHALLESIARQTGGELVPAEKLEAFAAGLPNRKAPVMESWSRPLWHRSGVFLFALACFVAEWGLRRSKGLA